MSALGWLLSPPAEPRVGAPVAEYPGVDVVGLYVQSGGRSLLAVGDDGEHVWTHADGGKHRRADVWLDLADPAVRDRLLRRLADALGCRPSCAVSWDVVEGWYRANGARAIDASFARRVAKASGWAVEDRLADGSRYVDALALSLAVASLPRGGGR